MLKKEFDQKCKYLIFRYCEVKLSTNKTIRGFILAKDDNPLNAEKGLFEISMGNMRVPLQASKTKSITLLK